MAMVLLLLRIVDKSIRMLNFVTSCNINISLILWLMVAVHPEWKTETRFTRLVCGRISYLENVCNVVRSLKG
jgi:hypothetical protein